MQAFSAIQSSAGSVFSVYAQLAAYRMLGKTVINDVIDVIPSPIKSYVTRGFSSFFKFKAETKLTTIVIEEQSGMFRNAVFDYAEVYLSTKLSPNADRFKVNKTPKQKKMKISMEKGQLITDTFRDDSISLEWRYVLVQSENQKPAKCFFELSFEKQHRDVVVDEYLPFVMKRADEIKNSDRAVRLYAKGCPGNRDDDDYGGNRLWGSVKLDHPSTFDKLAMEPEMKKALIEDLERFLSRKDYYKKVGKAWKRGYLLYGPPGTGKSSLIAAIANYLKFDIYDLELSSMCSNSELRSTMLSTTNRSIIVIEDIDCSVQTHDREQEDDYDEPPNTKFTLSGLLNFIDGLWSSCGDERIIIFTTNHKDKLDPALLRPGRMDMHIHLSYCTPAGFRLLASNYQGIDRKHNERLFDEIEGLIESCEVTPAVIAEELMRSEDADAALEGVKTLLTQNLADKNAAAAAAAAAVELKDDEEEGEDYDEEEEKVEDDQQGFEEVGRKRIPSLRGGCVRGRKQMRRG